MLPRYMIRSHLNHDHVFCAVSQGNVHKIVKVQLSSRIEGKVEVKDVHTLIGGMVTCLECDPEHSERIYLLDNYSNVF